MNAHSVITPRESGATNAADKRGHKGPYRLCLGTGEMCDKVDMIRCVVAPDGEVVPDILGKLPGRGVWIKASKAVLEHVLVKKDEGEDMASEVESVEA